MNPFATPVTIKWHENLWQKSSEIWKCNMILQAWWSSSVSLLSERHPSSLISCSSFKDNCSKDKLLHRLHRLVGVMLKLRINLISLYAEVELNKFVTISWKPSGKLENPYKPNKRILYLQMMFDLEVSLIGLFPPLPSLPGFSLCLPLLSPLPPSNRLWYFIKGWLLHFHK